MTGAPGGGGGVADAPLPRGRRRLNAQWAITTTLARRLTPPEVTRAVLNAARDGLAADAASIALLDAEGVTLQVTDVAAGLDDGSPHRVAERSLPVSAPESVAAVARDGQPRFEEGGRDGGGGGGGGGSLAAAPLATSGRIVGSLCLYFRAPRRFDDDERAFVLAVAQQYAEAAERARLYEAEHQARAQAEAASRAKSHFLTTMSHEIRTPLNAVVGYTELLEMAIAGPVTESQRGYLERIRASSRHLLSIVNDMLDLSKVEAGRLLVSRAEASACAAIEAALTIVHAQATGRSIALATGCTGEGDVHYVGDARRVEQILLNLLSNALRFTDPGGRVTVGWRRAGAVEFPRPSAVPVESWCAIDVQDTGIGIEADHLPSIFDPFTQVHTGLTRQYGGSGLGLAISRRLARAMDGDITVRSAPGEGSTFTLWLPAAPAPAAASEPPAPSPATAAPVPPPPAAGSAPRTVRPAVGLAEVGDAVLGDVEGIVKRYMARLRTDPRTPSAAAMKDTELEDHSAIFVSDLAQALAIAEEAEGEKSVLVRHDHDIQHLIAERHGELRRDLGWTEAELERDFEIMWEEVERSVRAAIPPEDVAGAAEGLAALKRFVDRADETSRRAYRRKAAADAAGASPA